MAKDFSRVDTWIFDLDNTLYPASCRLFDQMDVKMGEFVARLFNIDYAEAKVLQKQMFYKHGTTLRGLMVDHGVKPTGFLDYVHDIDYAPVPHSPLLSDALGRLAGRKLVFTNGTVAHAERTMARLGITQHFEDIFDIIHADYEPKPARAPYEKFLARTGVTPRTSAFFEDIAHNLEVPHAMGMATVLVTSPANHEAKHLNWNGEAKSWPHVEHTTGDLTAFLASLSAPVPD